MLEFRYRPFNSLSAQEAHDLFRARQEVFVLEQTCLYPDIDGLDPVATHLLGYRMNGAESELLAYLRVLGPGLRFAEPSLGRILTTKAGRKQGLGKRLVGEGIRRIRESAPNSSIRISAQLYLDRFYRGFGFIPVGEEYLEDGIPHRDMLLPVA